MRSTWELRISADVAAGPYKKASIRAHQVIIPFADASNGVQCFGMAMICQRGVLVTNRKARSLASPTEPRREKAAESFHLNSLFIRDGRGS
jgi:hypothetical protein